MMAIARSRKFQKMSQTKKKKFIYENSILVSCTVRTGKKIQIYIDLTSTELKTSRMCSEKKKSPSSLQYSCTREYNIVILIVVVMTCWASFTCYSHVILTRPPSWCVSAGFAWATVSTCARTRSCANTTTKNGWCSPTWPRTIRPVWRT